MKRNHPPTGIRLVQLDIDCEDIIRWAERQTTWEVSTTADAVMDDYRTSDTLFIKFHSYANDLVIEDMHRKVYNELMEYSLDFGFAFSDIENVSLQRYGKGKHYKEHYDSDPDTPRIVSAVLYLNTINSGGETYFTHFDYAVKPKAGRLAIFPSDYLFMHEARPPKSGTKYAAAYWAMP